MSLAGIMSLILLFTGCTENEGDLIVQKMQKAPVNGVSLAAFVEEKEKALEAKGTKADVHWGHKQIDENTYEIFAELKVPGTAKPDISYEWEANRKPEVDSHHFMIKAKSKPAKDLARIDVY